MNSPVPFKGIKIVFAAPSPLQQWTVLLSILRLFKSSYFSTAHKEPLSHMRAEVVQECLLSVIRDEGW